MVPSARVSTPVPTTHRHITLEKQQLLTVSRVAVPLAHILVPALPVLRPLPNASSELPGSPLKEAAGLAMLLVEEPLAAVPPAFALGRGWPMVGALTVAFALHPLSFVPGTVSPSMQTTVARHRHRLVREVLSGQTLFFKPSLL